MPPPTSAHRRSLPRVTSVEWTKPRDGVWRNSSRPAGRPSTEPQRTRRVPRSERGLEGAGATSIRSSATYSKPRPRTFRRSADGTERPRGATSPTTSIPFGRSMGHDGSPSAGRAHATYSGLHVDAPLLRAPRHVARAGPCLGDRRSRAGLRLTAQVKTASTGILDRAMPALRLRMLLREAVIP
jgi:hypothetical protein